MRFRYFYMTRYTFAFITVLYCVLNQSYAAGQTKHVYFQIDEFIKQLMTSEKFDELADVIADKAALKIKNMEAEHFIMAKSNSMKKTYASEEQNQNQDSERSKSDDQDNDKNTKTKQFGKIDSQAFLKKHVNSKEFELNFKHLTREKQRPGAKSGTHEKNSHRDRDNKHNDDDEDDRYRSDHNVKSGETNAKKPDGKSLEAQNYNSKEDKPSDGSHEKSTFHGENKQDRSSGEFRNENISGSGSQEDNHARKDNPKSKERSNSGETKIAQRTFKKSKKPPINKMRPKPQERDKSKISNNLHKTSQKRPGEIYSSTEVLEIGINRAVDDENSVYINERPVQRALDSSENSTDATQNSIINNVNQNKQHMRIENGKLFKFNSSPDYAEYHETFNNKSILQTLIN